MRLEQGTSCIRVMGNPIQFYVHWVELSDGSKRKVNSPISDEVLVNELEDADFKRKARWIVKVLDRDDDTFKLLEIGPQIYNGIRALYNNEKWGKVTDYDLDIIRGKPGTNPLYSVLPNQKEKLDTKFKQAFMDFNESINILALTKPADPVDVRKLLGWSEPSEDDSSDTSTDAEEENFGFEFE